MKTTARPNQSNDLAQDSEFIASSAMEMGQWNAGSDSIDLSDTQRWAETPSKWEDEKWDRDACLEFRVRCEGQPTRRLRLAGARYTLGNGVGCSIRLDDSSLRPLHAVLIRDRERVLVRAYSVPFHINNVRVTEGTLELNDRLSLGNYEFELLANSPLPVGPTKPIAKPANPETKKQQDEWQKSFHDEAKHWRALKHDVERREDWCRTREREVTEQRQRLDRQMELLQKRQDELASQESAALEVHDEFTQRYDDLRQRQEELELQQEELNAGREHLRLQQERLDGRDRLHRTQIEKLLSEQDRFKDLDAAQKQLLADTEAQLEMSHERADAANAAVEQMRTKFASLNEQLLQLTQQQEALQRLEAERNQEHQVRCDTLAAARDEAISQRDDMATQRDLEIDARARSDARREKTLLRCDELESIEEQLRADIQQLQDEITETRSEATKLDEECRSARETIARLEQSAETTEQRHESDRESWTIEVEALRKNVDELTLELAGAQVQLTKLRDENDRLAEQLTGAHQERDDARQKQEAAAKQCDDANQRCQETKAELEAANAKLDEALTQCATARRERDEIDQQRTGISGELNSTLAEREEWERRTERAERRYTDAQTMLSEARDQWQKAEHARDDAETSRDVAEQNLAQAQRDLQAMTRQRDEAVNEFDDLRRQRDKAVNDADETRRLYDRSNRDHDETLDRIEHLEQRTRDVIEDKKKRATIESVEGRVGPRLGLVGEDVASLEGVASLENVAPLEGVASLEEVGSLKEVGSCDDDSQDPNPISMPIGTMAPSLANEIDESSGVESVGSTLIESPMMVAPPTETETEKPIQTAAGEGHSVSGIDDDVWPTYSVSETSEPDDASADDQESLSMPRANANPLNDAVSAPVWPDEGQSLLRPEERLDADAESASTGWNGLEPETAVDEPATTPVPEVRSETISESAIFEEPEFESPELEASAFDSPSFETDSYEAPSYDDSSFSEPSYDESVVDHLRQYDSSVDDDSPASATMSPEVEAAFDQVGAKLNDSHPHDSETSEPLASEPLAEDFADSGYGSLANYDVEHEDEPQEESLSDRLLREMGIAKTEREQSERTEPSALSTGVTGIPSEQVTFSRDSAADEDEVASNAWGSLPHPELPQEPGLSQEPESFHETGAELDDHHEMNMTAQWTPTETFDDDGSEGFASVQSPFPTADEESPSQYGAMLSEMAENRLHDGDPDNGPITDKDVVGSIEDEDMHPGYTTGTDSTLNASQSHVFTEAEEVAPAEDFGSETVIEPTKTEQASTPVASDDSSGDGADDDSIEAYMNRLLQRVQGEPTAASAAPAKKPTSPTPKAESGQSKSVATQSDAGASAFADLGSNDSSMSSNTQGAATFESVPGESTDANAPLIPRSQAPERNSNLSAMRELANESARSAITRSNRSQSHTTRIQAMLKFIYAGIALVCGLVAVAMIDLMMLKFIAVIAAVVAAAIFVKEGFTLMMDLNNRSKASTPSEAVEEY